MPFFEPTRFEGSLSGHGSSIPIGFTASIDDLGELQLDLDRIPFSREAYALHVNSRPGTPVDEITLIGESASGQTFGSESFFIARFNHGSQQGEELSYQGHCDDAELVLPGSPGRQMGRDALVWLVRQLRTFRVMPRETPLGRVVAGGPLQDEKAQEPNGVLAIYRPEGCCDETWWSESERFLTHLARVLSFACDTYLLPVIEERYTAGKVSVRILRRGPASSPFMPPFHKLHMEPIFACACDSFFTRHDEVEDLDAAIRWLTAPVAYDESRLLNAMNAIENILDRCGLSDIADFITDAAFKDLARKIRAFLKEIGAPAGVAGKVNELNRRALREKVEALLSARNIVTRDMPADWLTKVIQQRNLIIHTGVAGDIGEHEPDTLDHTIWAREILVRVILERLGYEGAYRSWLHHDEQLHFPDCITMQEGVALQETESPP